MFLLVSGWGQFLRALLLLVSGCGHFFTSFAPIGQFPLAIFFLPSYWLVFWRDTLERVYNEGHEGQLFLRVSMKDHFKGSHEGQLFLRASMKDQF